MLRYFIFISFAGLASVTYAQTHIVYPECPEHKPVTIVLFNSTGHDIDSLIFENVFIQSLKKDAVMELSVYAYSTCGFPTGKIKGLDVFNPNYRVCCSRAKFYCNTTLAVEIKLFKDDVGYYLNDELWR